MSGGTKELTNKNGDIINSALSVKNKNDIELIKEKIELLENIKASKEELPNYDSVIEDLSNEIDSLILQDKTIGIMLTNLQLNKAEKSQIPDMSNIASKSEIPSISNLATKNRVEEIANYLEALTGDVENISAEIDYKINRSEVEHLIANIQQFKHQKVDELPPIGSESILYLLPTGEGIYEEYIWIDSEQKYEDIGSTAIDLTGYAKIEDIPRDIATTTQLVTLSTQTARYDLSNAATNVDYVISEQTYGDGESGKRKWRNGRLEQWGVATTSSTGETEFTMHEAHKDQNFSVFVEPREKGNFFHYAYPSGNQKFKCRVQTSAGTLISIKIQWRSYGYWK